VSAAGFNGDLNMGFLLWKILPGWLAVILKIILIIRRFTDED